MQRGNVCANHPELYYHEIVDIMNFAFGEEKLKENRSGGVE